MYRSTMLARAIPHAQLRVVDRCGHIAMLEQPGEFNRHVDEFLRDLDAGVAAEARA
jgi:pimeloyl-ACP methyl ester carboxylesterase